MSRFGLDGASVGDEIGRLFPGTPWLVERARAGFEDGASNGTGRIGSLDVEVHCSRALGGEPGSERLVLVLVDVSERLSRERELKLRSNLLEWQNEASPDGLLVVSPQRGLLVANRRFREIWGLSPDLVQAGSDDAMLAAASKRATDPATFLARAEWLYQHPEAESREEITLVDGTIIERYTAPVVDAETGVRYGRLWSFRDITARHALVDERLARHAAENSERRLAILAESSRVISGDLDDAALRELGRTLVPYLGSICALCPIDPDQRLRAVVADAGAGDRADAVAAILADPERSASIEEAARKRVPSILPGTGYRDPQELRPVEPPPGNEEPALMSALAPLRLRSSVVLPIASGEEVLGYALFASEEPGFFDAARVELAQQVLSRLAVAIVGDRLHRTTRAAVAARDEFLSIASHELRTPIAGLSLAVDGIVRLASTGAVPSLPPRVATLLANCQDHLRHLSGLVDRLLDVTRIRSGQFQLELEDVDLVAVTRQVVDRLCMEVEGGNCDVSVTADAAVVGLWDRARLEQVVTNLVSNALKYGAGRPIEMRVLQDGTLARLSIRDHGIGIAPDRIGRIFERFERAAPSRSYGGLGLGLYIVRQIVSRLGGTVSVESSLGIGSTFLVELDTRGPSEKTLENQVEATDER